MQYLIYRRWMLKTAFTLGIFAFIVWMIRLRIFFYVEYVRQDSCNQGMTDYILFDQTYEGAEFSPADPTLFRYDQAEFVGTRQLEL